MTEPSLVVRRQLARMLEDGRLAAFPRSAGVLAHVYGSLARRHLGRTHAFSSIRGVVGVGGSTLGGSWKTPVALALAASLAHDRVPVRFLAHGYGGRVKGARDVSVEDDPALVGDEALLAVRVLAPTGVVVTVDPQWDTLKAPRLLTGIVVVDGSLAPGGAATFRLLALDGERPWGAGACPPSGDLRAPASALLASADAVVSVEDIRQPDRAPSPWGPPSFRATFDLQLPATLLSARVALVTLLARPERVRAALRRRGVHPVLVREFPDHGGVGVARAVEASLRRAMVPFDVVLTTEKGACWLPASVLGRPVVAVGVRVTLPAVLLQRVAQRMGCAT